MNEQSPKSPTWQLATRRRFGNGAIGVQARLPDGHALSSWACDNDNELGLSFREASHDAGWPALANVRSKALLLALTAFESSRPVDRDHANKGERHSEFRLDVRQELSNPLRGVSLPIDDGRIAMCKISVKPEGGPQQRDDMPDDRCLAHDFTRFQERRSAHQHVTPRSATLQDFSRPSEICLRRRSAGHAAVARRVEQVFKSSRDLLPAQFGRKVKFESVIALFTA